MVASLTNSRAAASRLVLGGQGGAEDGHADAEHQGHRDHGQSEAQGELGQQQAGRRTGVPAQPDTRVKAVAIHLEDCMKVSVMPR
jgi:hypothetical protein